MVAQLKVEQSDDEHKKDPLLINVSPPPGQINRPHPRPNKQIKHHYSFRHNKSTRRTFATHPCSIDISADTFVDMYVDNLH